MANARERSRAIGAILRTAAARWLSDRCDRLGAALAFYAIFSLFPLLLLSVTALGYVIGQEASTQAELAGRVTAVTGSTAVRSLVEDTLASMQAHRTARGVGSVIGLVTLFFGASAAFYELTSSINAIWSVRRIETSRLEHSVLAFVRDKLLSFLLVVASGIVLLVWLVLGTALSAFQESGALQWVSLEPIASMVLVAFTLAALYRVLPRAPVAWGDVVGGAVVAAALLTMLRHLLASYLAHVGSYAAYGVVGGVLALLIAIYLSSLAVFFGAEVARVQAERRLVHPGSAQGPASAPPLRTSAPPRRPRPVDARRAAGAGAGRRGRSARARAPEPAVAHRLLPLASEE
jgi:membrane protein